jgi:ATP-binding cassette subfamily D (ALD) protein 3
MTRLAGFTTRVTDFLTVLQEVSEGKYKRTMLSSSNGLPQMPSGTVMYQDYVIEFENVPLTTPNGDVLIKDLSFRVTKGMNVLVRVSPPYTYLYVPSFIIL